MFEDLNLKGKIAVLLIVLVVFSLVLFFVSSLSKPQKEIKEKSFVTRLNARISNSEFVFDKNAFSFFYPAKIKVVLSVRNSDAVEHSIGLRYFDEKQKKFVYLANSRLKPLQDMNFVLDSFTSNKYEFFCSLNCPVGKNIKGVIFFK